MRLRHAWRVPVAIVTISAAAVAASLGVGLATGMPGGELADIAELLVPAAIASLLAAIVVARSLARAPLRQRFIAIAVVGVAVAIASIGLLASSMFVSDHDAAILSAARGGRRRGGRRPRSSSRAPPTPRSDGSVPRRGGWVTATSTRGPDTWVPARSSTPSPPRWTAWRLACPRRRNANARPKRCAEI